MKQVIRVGLLAILVGVVSYVSMEALPNGHAANANDGWATATIAVADRPWRGSYSYTAIAVDTNGQPYISLRGPSNSLRSATLTASGWQVDIVDDPPVNVARESDMVLNAAGERFISFSGSDGGNENLKLAQFLSGTWQVNEIYSPGSVGMENSIALDAQGHVHIAHYEWSGARLRYTTNKSGTWQTSLLVDSDLQQDRTAIAVDSLGQVHIIYKSLSGVVVHLSTVGGVWTTTDVGRCEETACGVALAIDAANHLHVVYSLQDTMMYATNGSGEWVKTAVIGNVQTLGNQSLALAPDGTIHISYYDSAAGTLNYAHNILGIWSQEVVDAEGDVGRSNDIAVDNEGYVHISYRDDGNTSTSQAVWGDSPTNIYAVGNGQRLLHYNGRNWGEVASDSLFDLYGLWGGSATSIFAVGDHGTILYFDGINWQRQVSGTADDLRSVWGTSRTNVYAVGERGTILHYDGQAWTRMASGTNYYLWDIWGAGDGAVFAVGQSGRILRFDGTSWQRVDDGSVTSHLRAVWGNGANNIFAVGTGGAILHYNGTSWQRMPSGTNRHLYDVWGSSSSDIFAVGALGTIIHYDGAAWSTMPSATGNTRYAVWGTAASNLYALGQYGDIVRYNGTRWASMLVPRLKYATTRPQSLRVTITEPVGGSSVPQRVDIHFAIDGSVPVGYHPVIVVRDPLGGIWSWLNATAEGANRWVAPGVIVGTTSYDCGKDFTLYAIFTSESVRSGRLPRLPEGPRDQVTVTRHCESN